MIIVVLTVLAVIVLGIACALAASDNGSDYGCSGAMGWLIVFVWIALSIYRHIGAVQVQ